MPTADVIKIAAGLYNLRGKVLQKAYGKVMMFIQR
jgi:hypothetical protein